jgi:hypothetical protein
METHPMRIYEHELRYNHKFYNCIRCGTQVLTQEVKDPTITAKENGYDVNHAIEHELCLECWIPNRILAEAFDAKFRHTLMRDKEFIKEFSELLLKHINKKMIIDRVNSYSTLFDREIMGTPYPVDDENEWMEDKSIWRRKIREEDNLHD